MSTIKDLVDTATSENAVGEDWGSFLDICQLVDESGQQGARECVLAIAKRLPHRNPNVALLALALTEGLVKNCDIHVQREISSRQFTEVLVKVLNNPNTHAKIKSKILALIHHCVVSYSSDPLLGYMADVKTRLMAQGHPFPDISSASDAPKRPTPQHHSDQDEIAKRKEQEDIELAIALSLSEAENAHKPPKQARIGLSSARPRSPVSPPIVPSQLEAKIKFHVRALYQFAGTDRGDLPFNEGDVIGITDSDYDDWWEGTLRGKTGLIPSNYVARLDGLPHGHSNKSVGPAVTGKAVATPTSHISSLDAVLAEHAQVDAFLEAMTVLNPHTTSPLDDASIQSHYRGLVDLRPALVAQLTTVRARRDRLLDLNDKLTRARVTYDRLLDTAVRSAATTPSPATYQGGQFTQGYGPPPSLNYAYNTPPPGSGPAATICGPAPDQSGLGPMPVMMHTGGTQVNFSPPPGYSTVPPVNHVQHPYQGWGPGNSHPVSHQGQPQ